MAPGNLCRQKWLYFSEKKTLLFYFFQEHACDDGGHGCEHVCIKKDTEYICACHDGYKLRIDNHSCQKVNPCDTENGGCSPHADCTNNNGVAECACENGYEGDGKSCTRSKSITKLYF